MNNIKKNTKQLKLQNFCKEFNTPRTTVLEWIRALNFPAYKIQGRWYVDLEEYYKWRTAEHERNYLYAG